MDPLSISVSIIAILQASNAVLSICYDYRAAVKGSSWALTRVTEEVKALRTVVETLENLTADALVTSEEDNTNKTIVSRLPTLDLLCKSNGDKGALLDLCLKELKGIERKLTPPGWAGAAGSKRLAAVRALGWPFQENDLTKRCRYNLFFISYSLFCFPLVLCPVSCNLLVLATAHRSHFCLSF